MENLGLTSVCLLEQLRPLLLTWTFGTYCSKEAHPIHYIVVIVHTP
jgi:hypothetical protein